LLGGEWTDFQREEICFFLGIRKAIAGFVADL